MAFELRRGLARRAAPGAARCRQCLADKQPRAGPADFARPNLVLGTRTRTCRFRRAPAFRAFVGKGPAPTQPERRTRRHHPLLGQTVSPPGSAAFAAPPPPPTFPAP